MGNPYLNIVGVGDAADYLRQLPDACIDAWVTDPPAGIGFMGVGWDTFADRKGDLGKQDGTWDKPGGTKRNAANSAEHAQLNRREGQRFITEMTTIFDQCYRVMKPGAHGVVWALPRTSHWTGVALEDAGFELRDMVMHVFGCLSADTEIMLDGRWEPYQNCASGRLALCYDPQHDSYSWQPIEEVYVYWYSDTAYRVRGDHTDQLVTKDHRCLVEQDGAFVRTPATEAARQRQARVPVLEDVQGLLDAVPMPRSCAGAAQQDVRTPVRGGRDTRSSTTHAETGTATGVRDVRTDVHAEVAKVVPEKVLAGVLRAVEGRRSADQRALAAHRDKGPTGVDGGIAAVLPEEDVWTGQSGLEGRGDLLPQARQLRECEVRPVPAGVQGDVAQGRLRDGAQATGCAGDQPPTCPAGDRPSRGPRSNEQRPVESDAVRVKPGPQAVRGARFTTTDLVRFEPTHYEGVVWCVKVPTKCFVARRRGQAFVTGNTGFPKSHDVSKAVDEALGATPRQVGTKRGTKAHPDTGRNDMPGKAVGVRQVGVDIPVTEPVTEEAKLWKGWGTALKPGYEVWWLVRKPPISTIAANVLEHGTGALNIDASRVGPNPGWSYPEGKGGSGWGDNQGGGGLKNIACESSGGRWPANVMFSHLPECEVVGVKRVRTGTAVRRNLPPEGARRYIANCPRTQRGADETYADADGKEDVEDWKCAPGCQVAELDQQSGNSSSPPVGSTCMAGTGRVLARWASASRPNGYGDDGGASRFFYTPKAATKERWAYCTDCHLAFQHDHQTFKEHADHDIVSHPTQKPLELMGYLIKLVTPPNGVVLDTFCGTGTTAVAARTLGFQFVTCDREEPYALIARTRLAQLGTTADTKAALASGAYFCPGCKAKGEIKLIAKAAVDRMRESGRKTSCMKCMGRFSITDLTRRTE